MNNKLEKLVQNLFKEGNIKSEILKQVLLTVDLKQFVDESDKISAYEDQPFQLGFNATISAPHILQALDIGSGSGYLCAAMFFIMKSQQSKVIGEEHVPELVEKSIKNLSQQYLQVIVKDKQIQIIKGDGRLGFEQEGPYQAIHVGAAAETIPQKLLEQLDNGGRMVIPVGKGNQVFQVIDKDQNGKINIQNVQGVRYVPLTDLNKQLNNQQIDIFNQISIIQRILDYNQEANIINRIKNLYTINIMQSQKNYHEEHMVRFICVNVRNLQIIREYFNEFLHQQKQKLIHNLQQQQNLNFQTRKSDWTLIVYVRSDL
ncbi:unnamed protein product [Paramecium octaurelia]|uniref:Protein-L-isoaspartate(D-aspartate) O-methyltransferase n=1 Tax=Paramecium octaurelia TaxID=43137 RepID=A0A8S1V8I0_PAROT|nr:unnamed protein product [Paramecium octaurelia]